MSRIGKLPVEIVSWVSIEINWNLIKVTWSKWTLEFSHHKKVSVKIEDNKVLFSVSDTGDKESKWLWGLTRTLVQNMIIWVSKWFEKKLEIIWVWYRANIQGKKLNLTLWFSHPVELDIPEWLLVTMDDKVKNIIIITWIDKQKVWQFAAEVRAWKKPEPYKWKWIRYVWEYVARKAGKSAAAK